MAIFDEILFPSLAWSSFLSFQGILVPAAVVSLGVLIVVASRFRTTKRKKVPEFPGLIPVVSNTILYMTDMKTFLSRAS